MNYSHGQRAFARPDSRAWSKFYAPGPWPGMSFAQSSRMRFGPKLEALMHDTTATKVDSTYSPHGPEGQKYLASSIHVGMRLWEDEQPGEAKPSVRRAYETVGYVIKGKAELHI